MVWSLPSFMISWNPRTPSAWAPPPPPGLSSCTNKGLAHTIRKPFWPKDTQVRQAVQEASNLVTGPEVPTMARVGKGTAT